MLRCKQSYADICPIEDIRLVGNSLVAWPAKLKNCRRVPHPQRETKPVLRDKILCRESNGHVGNVQNNLAIGAYKDKLVALFRASDTVLDCGQGTIIDFPSWKAMREMLATKQPEVPLTVDALLSLAGDAEEEAAAGLAEEVKVEPTAPGGLAEGADDAEPPAAPPAKRPKLETLVRSKDTSWLDDEFGDYPNAILLVSSTESKTFVQLLDECATTSVVAYDVQWSPDFDEGSDNPIALLQLGFPATQNTYVLQLPMLDCGWPDAVRQLFESPDVVAAGFAANDIDVRKFEISGINIDRGSLVDVQPWCEAEMGENDSVKQGWRVGIKRAAACVLDFEMDKTSTIASSNWEREELTTAQVEYAAMDVWVALRVYQRLALTYGKGAA